MLKQIKFLFFINASFSVFSSCQKEYSYENGDSLPIARAASFSLSNTSGNCSNVVVNGTFTAGTALTADNTIGIMVMVDSIGSYSINTDSNNGISFSANGVFTAAGLQTIRLSNC